MVKIFSWPLMRRYHGSYFSMAYGFRFITLLIQIVLPFVISYNIKPFWLKRAVTWTQPDVSFKYQMLLYLESNTTGTGLVWSTYDQLNTMLQTKYRAADIQVREEDVNFDGKADNIYLSARVPLTSTEYIYTVRFMGFFDYKIDVTLSVWATTDWLLQDKIKLQMDAATYFDYSSAAPGAECYVDTDMTLRQRSALEATTDWQTTYNTSLLDSTTIYSVAQARFSSLVTESMKRNGEHPIVCYGGAVTRMSCIVTTELSNTKVVWVAGRPDEFNLHVTIHVPYEQSVLYVPGAMETLRHALINYMVLYIIVAAIITSGTRYLFAYNVFETSIRDDVALQHAHQD